MSTPDRYNEELFLGYLEGDLTPEQIAEFEKLLAEDARLRNLVAQLVLDRHRLRKLPDEEAPVEVMDAVDRSMERRMLLGATPQAETAQTGVHRMRTGRWLVYSGIAAMIVLVAGLIARTLLDQPIINMAGEQPKRNETVAARVEKDDGKDAANQATTPLDRANVDTLAMASKDRIGEDANTERPPHAASSEKRFPQTFAAAGQPQGGGGAQPTGDAANTFDHQSGTSMAMRSAKQPKNGELVKTADGVSAEQSAGTAGGQASKGAVKPSAVNGKQPGERFRDADVPIAPMAQEELQRMENAGRVQLATSSPASTEADVIAWAQRHSVRIVSLSADAASDRNTAADSKTDAKKGREPGDLADKAMSGEITPKDLAEKTVTRGDVAGAARELVLVLSQKQVGELVNHLNTQRRNAATHTVTYDRGLAADELAGKTEANEGEKMQSKEAISAKMKAESTTFEPGATVSDFERTPASPAVSTPTPGPSVPTATAKPEPVVRLSVVISPTAATAASAKPAPATMPATGAETEASKSPAKN